MPRNVRNFWLDARIDGRQEILSGGPQGASGGFDATFYIRHHGQVVKAFNVWGSVSPEGKLQLLLTHPGNSPLVSYFDSHGFLIIAERDAPKKEKK